VLLQARPQAIFEAYVDHYIDKHKSGSPEEPYTALSFMVFMIINCFGPRLRFNSVTTDT
jgi:hypothetical protein